MRLKKVDKDEINSTLATAGIKNSDGKYPKWNIDRKKIGSKK